MDADKRQVWADIKRRAPDFARELTEIIQITGKPAAIRIEIDGEVLLDTGVNKTPPPGRARRRRRNSQVTMPLPAPKPPESKSRLPTLEDLRNACPEDLARMKALLRKKRR